MEGNSLELSDNTQECPLNIYPAGDPEHPDWYIYEYESHRKVLVEKNSQSGKFHFIKEL
ncbi:hypothetical protein [Sphingobacterium tabacisoli]|uniref:Uncharacterized protein n=1 Tax=Sphingobacterium tabacisoli TaxID=2044855 RepID=A0ABW5L9T4_9SPHI|nr:hypothetical protein [Sphingobacterium tabacisoli]